MKNLGFGLMRLPLINNEFSHVDKKMLCDMVDLYLDKGFQYFDTAWFYHDGQSELSIKDCLVDRYPRSAFLLADKMPLILIQEERELEEYFSAQLKRCGVDYFDYYLIHDMGGNRRKLAEDMHVFDFFSAKITDKWDNIELLEDDRKRIDLVECSYLHAIMDKMLW